mmetsp:Transcript_14100/g.22022  ORF Transcript_14100/g.22022 Transcript_14100/m.22022 type:complete len:586 (-) Transcript_14100:16-1773(-)|eukprot:CAMPEP_0195287938 /NCGR_PEP_ID=MMETSP0707-20130614/4797_1 /TAXON_ID=33640 /ORGANISM="Asterionellopsis glacialis, Strain CCMP134" /LENGTH=585 /DNA_ID=CAMNT_0040347743 /DNA_START=212 /DNA_END=1969 /DNA_ORIENTATION=+
MVLPNVYNLGYHTGKAVRGLIDKHEIPEFPPPNEIFHAMSDLPFIYKDWWLHLLSNDPVHLIIETTLIATIIYIVFSQSREWKGQKTEKLSENEKQELLSEWKVNGRQPLVPSAAKATTGVGGKHNSIVVEELNGRHMKVSIDGGKPKTVLNFATHDFLGMSAASTSGTTPLALSSVDDDVDNDKKMASSGGTISSTITSSSASPTAVPPGNALKDASKAAMSKYGCGSCGPRGFYGTIDVHLQLEESIAKFTGTDQAILYSDGASAVSSTVAAFAKRGDLLVVDEGVYEPLVTGVTLSRANVKWFRHNDMEDLRRVLERIRTTDEKLGRKANDQRRFIVCEGLYKNLGSIVPLADVVALKNEFKYRLVLDESFSFGTLGPTGKGVIEMYGKRHMYDAEIVTISLENSLGSIGGVTVGNEEVVDHQRLSGAGYCFSASSPPFTASAAIAALDQIEHRPALLATLNENKEYLYEKLKSEMASSGIIPDKILIASDERSPIVLLELSEVEDEDAAHEEEVKLLDKIVQDCLEGGVATVSTGRHVKGKHMHAVPVPAIRLTVSAVHTKADIDKAVSAVKKAAKKHLPK